MRYIGGKLPSLSTRGFRKAVLLQMTEGDNGNEAILKMEIITI